VPTPEGGRLFQTFEKGEIDFPVCYIYQQQRIIMRMYASLSLCLSLGKKLAQWEDKEVFFIGEIA